MVVWDLKSSILDQKSRLSLTKNKEINGLPKNEGPFLNLISTSSGGLFYILHLLTPNSIYSIKSDGLA